MVQDEGPWRSAEWRHNRSVGFSFVWLPGWQLTKLSLHLTAASSNDGERSNKVASDHCNPWPMTGRGEPPVPTPSSAAPSFSDSLFAMTGKTILSHLRSRSGDFYLECYHQLACLFQETEEKNISENRWANLLQVRLSGSCYATHGGRLGSCWGWVGRGRTDGKLRADGQQTWEKPTHSVSTAHMHCAMMD